MASCASEPQWKSKMAYGYVEAQGALGRKDGKLTAGIWLGLSTGWATVGSDRSASTAAPLYYRGAARALVLLPIPGWVKG